jgi:hypothetical protein
MTLFFNSIQETQLGFAAVFACMGIGFLFLCKADREDIGPEYWAISFFLNSAGFMFWSGIIPITAWKFYLLGELFHVSGFIFMVCGAYRFSGSTYRPWNLAVLAVWLSIWISAILLIKHHPYPASIVLKGLRSVLFISAGILIARNEPLKKVSGRNLTAWSLIAWGLYVFLFAFVRIETMKNFAYGLLVGFQILSSFGMIAMIVDRIRTRAKDSEKRVHRLEGLLPMCSYCKKIRNKNDTWQTLELYIEEKSAAEFSHGICPECLTKHYPDVKL